MTDEYFVKVGKKHFIIFFKMLFFIFIGFLFWKGLIYLSFFCFLYSLYLLLVYGTSDLVVTNKKVFFNHGILNTIHVEIKLLNIESVVVKRGLIGAFFDYGDIIVNGTGGSRIYFTSVSKPYSIQKAINTDYKI